jgi:hypothetical protein
MDLPKYDDTKRLSCPGFTTIKEVIEFADSKVNFSKHIIYNRNNGFNALEHIDITLPIIIEDGSEDFISFPQDTKLGVIFTFFLPLSGLPGVDRKDAALPLKYRSLRKKQKTVK